MAHVGCIGPLSGHCGDDTGTVLSYLESPGVIAYYIALYTYINIYTHLKVHLSIYIYIYINNIY